MTLAGDHELTIKQFTWNVVDANSFLILEGKHGLLIDVVDESALFESLADLSDLTVILTHSHFDHICGLNRLREHYPDTTVIATELCSQYIGNKYKNLSSTGDVFLAFYNAENNREGCDYRILPTVCEPADSTFVDEQQFSWCGHDIQMTAVHGHTDDSLIVLVDGLYLFSGDTLMHTPTVTRFPRGNTKRFQEEDLPLFRNLDPAIAVYPGHGNPGILKNMLETNSIL